MPVGGGDGLGFDLVSPDSDHSDGVWMRGTGWPGVPGGAWNSTPVVGIPRRSNLRMPVGEEAMVRARSTNVAAT